MAINASTVITVAPELASQDESRINYFIAQAALYINTTVWGAKSDFAHALLVAHLMTLSSNSGVGGAVTSERVGDLSRSYGNNMMGNSSLGATSYGQQFLELRKSLLISPIVVR